MRDSTRNLVMVVGLSGLIVFAAGAVGVNRQAIARARAQSLALKDQRDSLLAVAAAREAERAALAARADTLEWQAHQLRDSVDLLERQRAEVQLGVRQIRTLGALQTRLRQAFPELGRGGWGLTSLPAYQGDSIGIEYLLVPAWFAETFVIDRANARSWRAQRAKLLAVDSLRIRVAALQDSVVVLEAARADAFRAGYDSAYRSSQDLTQQYIAQLRKPRLNLGSTVGLLLGAGACVAAAGALR